MFPEACRFTASWNPGTLGSVTLEFVSHALGNQTPAVKAGFVEILQVHGLHASSVSFQHKTPSGSGDGSGATQSSVQAPAQYAQPELYREQLHHREKGFDRGCCPRDCT